MDRWSIFLGKDNWSRALKEPFLYYKCCDSQPIWYPCYSNTQILYFIIVLEAPQRRFLELQIDLEFWNIRFKKQQQQGIFRLCSMYHAKVNSENKIQN